MSDKPVDGIKKRQHEVTQRQRCFSTSPLFFTLTAVVRCFLTSQVFFPIGCSFACLKENQMAAKLHLLASL